MPDPMTAERMEWIRRCNREDKARHGASWEDHGEPAERHRDELLAEVDRLRAERDAYFRSLVALVGKVSMDQVPAYYERLVPTDVLSAAAEAEQSGGGSDA